MTLNGHAQLFEWGVDFHSFADNREYARTGRLSQTIIGLRLAPYVGLSLDSTHRIRVGADLLHRFGSDSPIKKIDPIVYYQYHRKKFNFYMGLVPREIAVGRISEALLNDTLGYSDPNISGIAMTFADGQVRQRLWLNWVSSPGYNRREQFRVGISGEVAMGQFYLGHQSVLWHYALSENSIPTEHIRDNLAIRMVGGFHKRMQGFIDSVNVSGGFLISFDRLRNVYDWRVPKGAVVNLYASHGPFFLDEEVYFGQRHNIPNGISFYNEKLYNRLDFGWSPKQIKRLDASLIIRFHFTEVGIDNQQLLSLRYHFGGSVPVR